jgi:hypothetical protein
MFFVPKLRDSFYFFWSTVISIYLFQRPLTLSDIIITLWISAIGEGLKHVYPLKIFVDDRANRFERIAYVLSKVPQNNPITQSNWTVCARSLV